MLIAEDKKNVAAVEDSSKIESKSQEIELAEDKKETPPAAESGLPADLEGETSRRELVANTDAVEKKEDDKPKDKKSDEVKDERSINMKTIYKILVFWGLTVPVAMFVSWSICKLLLINHSDL